MNTHIDQHSLQQRLRQLRESKNLTLLQASRMSKGQISPIALGSYERGDRSISTTKLFQIAQMYGVPIQELFREPSMELPSGRVIIDLRRLSQADTSLSIRFRRTLENLISLRRDWNGEVLSLRKSDLENLSTFAGFSHKEIDELIKLFGLTQLK